MKLQQYPKVLLTLIQNILYIDPWIPFLEKTLTCKRRTSTIGRGGRLETKISYEPLFNVSKNVGATFGGLFEKVKSKLALEGVLFEVDDQRKPLPYANLDEVQVTWRENQVEVFATILSSYGGLIVGPTALGKTFIICQICKVYPHLKILISTMRKPVLKSIAERVKEANPASKVNLVHAGSPPDPSANIAVVSAKSLDKIDPEWPDLFIFDEGHNAAAPDLAESLSKFTKPRMFAMTASPKGRCDGAEILIEALFGPVIYNLEYKDAIITNNVCPIEVRMLSYECAEIEKTMPSTWVKHNIWRNRNRNQKIAEAARHFQKDKVLILVSTAEHALYLQKLLPEYTLVNGGVDEERKQDFIKQKLITADTDLKCNADDIRSKFKSGEINKVISTFTWKEGVDFEDLAVLIRADGERSPITLIQSSGRLSRIYEGKEKGLVIDFKDDFCPRIEARYKARVKEYKRLGWPIVEGLEDPDDLIFDAR